MSYYLDRFLLVWIIISRENHETNFQKASSTLDASVKIYGCRVDDTLSTGYRILENLSRGSDKKPQTEVPKQSRKLGVANTLETNLQSIEMDPSDLMYDTDPLFHVMTRRFDEGGAKGLLLANLVVFSFLRYVGFNPWSEYCL